MTLDEARQQFSYDPDTGVLTRIGYCHPNGYLRHGRKLGKPAGYLGTRGDLQLTWRNRTYRVHQLAWLLHYGEWPKSRVHHKNHDLTDNRIANLELYTPTQSARNRRMNSNNTSGHTGIVTRDRASGYRAQITLNHRCRTLGNYEDLDSALRARKAAERRHGFHPDHGRPE